MKNKTKKRCMRLGIALAMVSAPMAFADVDWDGQSGGGIDVAANWTTDTLPNDGVSVGTVTDANAVYNTHNGQALAGYNVVFNGSSTFTNGATAYSSFFLGGGTATSMTFNDTSSAFFTRSGGMNLSVGWFGGNEGSLTWNSSGTFGGLNEFWVDYSGGAGTYLQTDGTVTGAAKINVGANGTLTLSGGTMDFSGALNILDGGTVDFLTTGTTGIIHVASGQTSNIEGYITAGKITMDGAVATLADFSITDNVGGTTLTLAGVVVDPDDDFTTFMGGDFDNAASWNYGFPVNITGVVAVVGTLQGNLNVDPWGTFVINQTAGTLTTSPGGLNLYGNADRIVDGVWNQSGGAIVTPANRAHFANELTYNLSGGTSTCGSIAAVNGGTFNQTGGSVTAIGTECIYGAKDVINLLGGTASSTTAGYALSLEDGSGGATLTVGGDFSMEFTGDLLLIGSETDHHLSFANSWSGSFTRDNYTEANWQAQLVDVSGRATVNGLAITDANFADLFSVASAGAVGSTLTLLNVGSGTSVTLPVVVDSTFTVDAAAGQLVMESDTSDINAGGVVRFTDPEWDSIVQQNAAGTSIINLNTDGVMDWTDATSLYSTWFVLGNNHPESIGILNLNGGTLLGADLTHFELGRSGAQGYFNISAGSATLGDLTIGTGMAVIDFTTNSTGTLTITGYTQTDYENLFDSGNLTHGGVAYGTFEENFELEGLALSALAGDPPPAPPSIDILVPLTRAVFQRNSTNFANIVISGTYGGPAIDQVEIRVTPVDGYSGTAISQTLLDSAPTNGTFSGSVLIKSGWYDIEVVGLLNGQPVSTGTVERVGIGEVFIVAGQSNSANYGYPKQIPKDDRISCTDLVTWRHAEDPQPLAGGNYGSPWPAFGDKLAEYLDVPVGVIAVGEGSTRVAQWLPAGSYYPRIKAAIDFLKPQGFRAIFWHQGEHDSLAGTSAASYKEDLETIIAQSRIDCGYEVPWGVAIASYHPDPDISEADMANVTNGQGQVIAADPLVFKGSETDDYHNHPEYMRGTENQVHFSAMGLTLHGLQWANIIREEIFPKPQEACQLLGAGLVDSNEFRITWKTESNVTYQVQAISSLTNNPLIWINVGEWQINSPGEFYFMFDEESEEDAMFFRVNLPHTDY